MRVICPSCVHEFDANDSNKDAQIAALTARLAEAEARAERAEADASAMSAGVCSDLIGDAHGNPTCAAREQLAAAVARAERAERHLSETDDALDNANQGRDAALARVREVEEERDRLQIDVNIGRAWIDDATSQLAAARAEVVREFAEMLKKECVLAEDQSIGTGDIDATVARHLAQAGKEQGNGRHERNKENETQQTTAPGHDH